jgi:predicted metal-dependent enzyme (double-stranded beta helix superfamily)
VFDLDELVVRCVDAVGADEPRTAVRDVLDEAIRGRALRMGRPDRPSSDWLDILYRSPQLTVIHAVWPPHMRLYPHDHRMWAAIGIYDGQEDNTFYRRQEQTIVASGGRDLHERDLLLMGDDAIHAVHNPSSNYTGAIHVYGGDFVSTPRRQWDPETLEESPYDFEAVRAAFDRADKSAGQRPTQ